MNTPIKIERALYVDRYRSEAFRVQFRRSPAHPTGLYHVFHGLTEIGRQVSMPGTDDCERLLAQHAGRKDAQGRARDVEIRSVRIQSMSDMRRSLRGGNKGGRAYQVQKILKEVFE